MERETQSSEKTLMTDIAREIIGIKIKKSSKISDIYKEFYDIMRKYGIKQGTKSENGIGIIQNNFEWTMSKALFIDTVKSYMEIEDLLGNVPKDLQV